MTAIPFPEFGFRLRSAIPGRERWEVDDLRRRPLLAAELERHLTRVSGVVQVCANALTGRVLVVFEATVGRGVDDLIRSAIVEIYSSELGVEALERAAETWRDAPAAAQRQQAKNPILALTEFSGVPTAGRTRAIVLSVINIFAFLAVPLSAGLLVSTVVFQQNPLMAAIGVTDPITQVLLSSLLFLAGKAFETYVEYYRKEAWKEYATAVEHSLRTKAFEHTERLDMPHLEDQNIGRLMSLINKDTARISRFIEKVPHSTMLKVGSTLTVALGLLLVKPALGLLSLLPLPWILYQARKFHEESGQRFSELGVSTDHLHHLLSNSLAGLPTIKSFTAEEFELERFTAASQANRELNIEANKAGVRYGLGIQYANNLGMALALTYGGVLVLEGAFPVTMYVNQVFVVSRLLGTLMDLDHDYNYYEESMAAAVRLRHLFATESLVPSGGLRLQKDAVDGGIDISGVVFGYPGAGTVFDGIDLRFPPRATVGIVGATGAGKTSLIKLLLRFYDPQEGQVLLDGRDIREIDTVSLRQVIGLVSQDVYLFDGSVYDNILYGRPDAAHDEVMAAARAAEAYDFVQALPQGFDTRVGERGQKLSGGQRQRVTIARAVLKDPPILVLDEATSSLDSETEVAIHRSMERISKGRTTIIIAHRLSTVRNTDFICYLEDGAVKELGTHDQLLALDGGYAKLWKLQTGERDATRYDAAGRSDLAPEAE